MDPDGIIDDFHRDSPSGGVSAVDHPSSSGCYAAKDPPSSNATDSRNFVYSSADLASLSATENEAASIFPLRKTYDSPSKLRDEVRSFAYQKGFEIATTGRSICCSRWSVPKSDQHKREKKIISGVAPQRIHRSSTRCGCPFRITFSLLQRNDKSNSSIRITRSSIYITTVAAFPPALS
jgi:hypothetical protein